MVPCTRCLVLQETGEEVIISKEIIEAATYDKEGTVKYTATAIYGGEQYTKSNTKTIDKLVDTIIWVNAPAHKSQVYDGTAKTVSEMKETDFTWNGSGTASVKGYYTKTEDGTYEKTTIEKNGASEEGGAPVNAGTYYALVEVTKEGTSTALSDYMEFTITQAIGTLNVPTDPFNKTYGDKAFILGCTTNGDGTITYISDQPDVVSVDTDGTATIKGIGTAMITVSFAAGINYTGAFFTRGLERQ